MHRKNFTCLERRLWYFNDDREYFLLTMKTLTIELDGELEKQIDSLSKQEGRDQIVVILEILQTRALGKTAPTASEESARRGVLKTGIRAVCGHDRRGNHGSGK
jgi:predicted transcriptional regulator